jgi:CDGSH-type Zn-finger protein
MAIHETEERNGKLRTVMKLEPGERVALCRCMRSAEFPFCDGTHKDDRGQRGTRDCGGVERRPSKRAQRTSSYPVCPKPPSPRSDGGSSRTGVHSIRLTGATTSCAIRSPRRIVNGSCPQLMRMTCTSPR